LAKVILAKPESVNYSSFQKFDKKIFITRDPRDWIVSGTLFLIQQSEKINNNNNERYGNILNLLKEKEKEPSSISLIHILKLIYNFYEKDLTDLINDIRFQHKWLIEFEEYLDSYLKIRYEDFVTNNWNELEVYLGFKLQEDIEIGKEYGHVKRTKGFGDWHNWFTPEDIDFFKPLFRVYMKNYNYKSDWIVPYSQKIKPEHCSKYVELTASRRRNKIR